MCNPLVQQYDSAFREEIAIEFDWFDGPATETPRGRVDTPGLVHDPIEIGQPSKILRCRRSTMQDSMQLGQQLFVDMWVLCEQVEGPTEAILRGLVPRRHQSYYLITDLFIAQMRILVASGQQHREDIT